MGKLAADRVLYVLCMQLWAGVAPNVSQSVVLDSFKFDEKLGRRVEKCHHTVLRILHASIELCQLCVSMSPAELNCQVF